MPAPLLSFALKQAQSNSTDDRFIIAPGVFASSNFTYLQGIDNAEIIDTVYARRAPTIPVHGSLRP